MNDIEEHVEQIGKVVVNSAFKVHKALGPGLLEKVYEICLSHEISKAGINVLRQIDIPITYDGLVFNEGLRLDLLAGDEVVIEIKAVDLINPVWESQNY